MKVKQTPDDFQVEEISTVSPSTEGAYAFYSLDKTGWTTPDALAIVRRRWHLPPSRISFGGLKDRHAITRQYFTILRGPQRNLHHNRLTVRYLGQTLSPYSSEDIAANRFRLTLRDLEAAAVERALLALPLTQAHGVPNYFDDQRFGSVTEGTPFLARLLLEERYEEALRQALVAPYAHDRAAQKREKATLATHWGNWDHCLANLPPGHARDLVGYLHHSGGDFAGALERLRPELRGLYLSAYQSYLWNRCLAHALRQKIPPERLRSVSLRPGEVVFYTQLTAAEQATLADLYLPFASARLKLEESDPRLALVREGLAEEGLTLEQMKFKRLPNLFFSRGERPALLVPRHLEAQSADDELHRGKHKLLLSFELPRGSYATLLVKRLLL